MSGYVQQLSKSIQFPFGTLAVNVLGCAAIGFLASANDELTGARPGKLVRGGV